MEAIATAADSNPETIRRWTKTFNLKRKKIFSETHKARISKVWLGRKHKPESKEKIKQAQLGEKGHNWKGGHRTNARIQAPWKANRKAALKRDNYICQRCSRQRSDDGKSLDVHHKIPFRCFEVAAIAHELHNLQTLCRQCHFIVEAAMQVMDAQFGSGCTVWHFVNIYGARFGDNVSVGSYAEIGKNVTVGNDVAIGSQSFIPEGFKIGNNVFIGPRFCGTNDKYPPTPKDIWVPAQTVIEDDVSIGAAVVLLPGIVVGKGARIAAGSIVTRNVPPNTLVRGEPARERAYQSLMPLRLLRREMEPYV